MNRRQLILGLLALPTPLLAMRRPESPPEARTPVTGRSGKGPSYFEWSEQIRGEWVDFACHEDFDFNVYKVKAMWRSRKGLKRTYALGFMVTHEEIADNILNNQSLEDCICFHERTKILRIAMKHSIRLDNEGFFGSCDIAPIKPEGASVVYDSHLSPP